VGNTAGKRTNRGFEGLAISPDGGTVFAMLQSAMLDEGGSSGTWNRIVAFDTRTTRMKTQYAYKMEGSSQGRGISALVALNDHEFLVLERKFPRSIRYCVSKAERSLHAITETPIGTWESQPERQLGRLNAEFEFSEPREVVKGLHAFLDQFQVKLNDVGNAIFEAFFASRADDDGVEVRAASAE